VFLELEVMVMVITLVVCMSRTLSVIDFLKRYEISDILRNKEPYDVGLLFYFLLCFCQ